MENNSIDQIIKELSKIEGTATKLQTESEREMEEYAKAMEQKTREFDENLERETTERLAELEDKLQMEKKEELSAMKEDVLNKAARMEEIYEANCDKWAKKIMSSIIKE